MLRGKEKAPPNWAALWCDRVYKPGSVLTAIYLAPELLLGSSHLLGTTGPVMRPSHGVAPDRVYSIPMSPWDGCALTAPFHSYLPKGRRHISVALVLRSPSAGVTRYPCPMEPGLSSYSTFRLTAPFHSYLPKGRRHISVALVLRSPSAGVTRYPCPMEPGLSSYSTFRRLHAAVQPGCPPILSYQRANVKCLAKSFSRGYTKDR